MEKKVVLITGASSGLGAAITQKAREDEYFVVCTFREKNQVEHFNQQVEGQGMGVYLDLNETALIGQQVDDILAKTGRIDVLINNAGRGFAGAIEEASMDEARDLFEVNFFGVLALTQAVLPIMRNQGSGHIIQISSHAGVKAFAGFGLYNASKFALEGFSEALAQEVKSLGIKVTIVEPGPFRTNFAGRSLGMASHRLHDYDETAGLFRSKLSSVHGKQEGDPQKAADVIVGMIGRSEIPLRVPLGSIALKTIGMKIDELKSDLDNGASLARSVVF